MSEQKTPEQALQEAWSRAFIDTAGSRRLARQALEACDPASETAAWSRWLLALADVNTFNAPSARAFLYAARDWFVKHESARGQALCAELDAAMALQSGDAIRASLIHRALDGAGKQDMRAVDRFFSHYQRASFARSLGQWDLALRHLDAAWETAEISGNAGAVAVVRNQIGGMKLEYGHLDDAETQCEASLAMARELQSHEAVIAASINLIVIRDALGDFDGSRALAKALLDGPNDQVPGALARSALPLALTYVRAGEFDRADAWLEVSAGATAGDGETAVFWAWLTARCLIQRNEHAMAIDLCERVYAARKHRSLPFHLSQLLETLATAHGHLGHTLKSLQCREQVKRLSLGTYAADAAEEGLLSLSADPLSGARHSERV
jgi:hypothetical protein